jgi:hypothetical protein
MRRQNLSTSAGYITNVSNNNTIGTTGAKQKGICVVGAGGPCKIVIGMPPMM